MNGQHEAIVLADVLRMAVALIIDSVKWRNKPLNIAYGGLLTQDAPYLRRAHKAFRIKVTITVRPIGILSVLIDNFVEPPLQILVALAVGQVVHHDDAVCGIVKDATRVHVANRAADVEQFDEIGLLRAGALLVLVQFHLNRNAHRPAGRYERFIVCDQMHQRGFANT